MRIVIGCQNIGYCRMEVLKRDLEVSELVTSWVDVGEDADGHTPYPKVAIAAAELIARAGGDGAAIICGTGLGVVSAEKKVADIRLVTAPDGYSVERAVLSNKAKVLRMGQHVLGIQLTLRLIREWPTHRFDPSSASAEKTEVFAQYEATGSC